MNYKIYVNIVKMMFYVFLVEFRYVFDNGKKF